MFYKTLRFAQLFVDNFRSFIQQAMLLNKIWLYICTTNGKL
jgi:hypothetical protein